MAELISTMVTVQDAPPSTPTSKLYDYDGAGHLIYEGWALSSRTPLSSQPVWAIRKSVYTAGGLLISQAWVLGNSSYLSVWDNRAALVYA